MQNKFCASLGSHGGCHISIAPKFIAVSYLAFDDDTAIVFLFSLCFVQF